MKPQRSSVPTTLVHVAPSVRAVESALLPTAAGFCLCSPAEGQAPPAHQTSSVGLTGVPCQAFLNILSLEHFWLACLLHPAPSILAAPEPFPWLGQPKHPPQADRPGVPCQMSVLLKTKP